jgi:3-dehydroquinate synthase/2-deoxy-scyllo-inosose synthase
MIKNALAIEPRIIDLLTEKLDGRCELDASSLEWVVETSIATKARVTDLDPFEKRAALVLEYGHTVGHAIERASQGRVVHGEAVGLGMIVAADISSRFGWLSREEAALHRTLVARIGAPTVLFGGATADGVVAAVAADNKRGYRSVRPDESLMILLRGLGEPNVCDGVPLTAVPHDLLGSALSAIA